MDNDLEKLRQELKDKIDMIIDNYVGDENAMIEIPDDNIYMEFDVDGKDYIAFTEDSKDVEEIGMMFAKLEIIDGNRILRNIETAEEYEIVINEFNKRLELMLDEED